MSYTFTFTGHSSGLESSFHPPIDLEEGLWFIGLLSFDTYNSTPNITEENNFFRAEYVDRSNDPPTHKDIDFQIPVGTYSLEQLDEEIKRQLNKKLPDKTMFTLEADNSTQKVLMHSNLLIDFTSEQSPAKMLGFAYRPYEPNQTHASEFPVELAPVSLFRILCNVAIGSYVNGEASHVIHEFYPNVPPTFKIIEVPSNTVYLPINTKQIDNMSIRLVDENDKLLNLRDEFVTVRVHLKQL